MNARTCLWFLCATFLAVGLFHFARASSLSGAWIPLYSDSRNSVRSVIAYEVEKVTGYSTIEEGDANHRALLEEKEREDSASKAALAELEKRSKQAKRVRDTVSSSFSEKSSEYEDSRKNFLEITTAIQNLDSKIGLCEKEIVAQQEHLKKYLKTEKQGEALTAVIHTQGMRDTLHDLNRRADELSAPELASYMGTTIQSYTEVVGGILSLDFIRSITEGTAKPVNEEPVRIQLDVTSKGTKFLRVKRYELYPFQESGETKKTSRVIAEKSNLVIIVTFSELEQLLSRNGYQIAKYDTSRISKLIDEVRLVNRQQNEALKETIAATQERISNQRAKIAESMADRERDLVKKARIEETAKRLATELAIVKERKDKAEAELAIVQSQLNERKRVSETIIPKFALQASKGAQSPADASIEAIIDKLEEVKNEARVLHSRESVEVTNSQATSYEQAQSSTEARVTAVRLISLTNEGSNGVRVRVAFRVRTVISENGQKISPSPPPSVSPAAPQPQQQDMRQKQAKKGKKAKNVLSGQVKAQTPSPQPPAEKTTSSVNQQVNEVSERPSATGISLTLVKTLTQHSKGIKSVAFSNDGARAASGDRDNNIITWDTHTWTPLATLKGHRNNVQTLSFSNRGRYLASGSSDETVIIWDLVRKAPRLTIKTDKNVNALDYNPADTQLATGIDSRDITIWDAATGAIVRTFRSENDVLTLAYSPNGHLLATAGKEKVVHLWNVTGKGEAHILEGHRDDVRTLAFAPGGSQLATGGDDKSIIIWNVATGSIQKKLEGHENKIVALAITSDGNRLVSADNRRSTGTIIVWDLKSGTIIKRFTTEHKIECFSMSSNGRTILVGSDKTLLVYRLD